MLVIFKFFVRRRVLCNIMITKKWPTVSYTDAADEMHRTNPGINADLSHFAGTDIVGFLELESFMYDCLLALDSGGMYFSRWVRRVVVAIYSAKV